MPLRTDTLRIHIKRSRTSKRRRIVYHLPLRRVENRPLSTARAPLKPPVSGVEIEIPLDDIVVHEWPSRHCVHTLFIYIQNYRERRNDGESCTIYLFEVSKIGRPNLPGTHSSLWPPGSNEIPLNDIVVHEWPSRHCVRTPFVYIQNDRERPNDGESCTIYLFEVSKIGRPNLPGARSSLQSPGSKTKYGSMTSWYMSGRHVTAYGRPSYIYKTIANVETTANRVPFTSTKSRKSAA